MFKTFCLMSGLLLLLLLQAVAALPRDSITSSLEDIQNDDTHRIHIKEDSSLQGPSNDLALPESIIEEVDDDDDDKDDLSEVSPLHDELQVPKSRVKRGKKTEKAVEESRATRVRRKSAKKAAKKLATAYATNKMMKKKKKGGFLKIIMVVLVLTAILIGAFAFCLVKVRSMYSNI